MTTSPHLPDMGQTESKLGKCPYAADLPLIPDEDELDGFRNGIHIKANPCFDCFNLGALSVQTLHRWSVTFDQQVEFEEEGKDIWQDTISRLQEHKSIIVGTLRGTDRRIVIATSEESVTDGRRGKTLPRLLFFALPFRRSNKDSGIKLCNLEDLEDQCDVEEYAPFLLINDLAEIDFNGDHGADRVLLQRSKYERAAEAWQREFGVQTAYAREAHPVALDLGLPDLGTYQNDAEA
ncbi:hypothetical protein Q7P35_005580 [Cladosporium inversicolor]